MESYIEEHIYQVRLYEPDRRRIDNTNNDPEQDSINIIWDWCERTFGECYDSWYHIYSEIDDADTFCFNKDEDRTWFIMRWS